MITPPEAGNLFRFISLIYRLLPRPLRNSAKIAHHASVFVSRFMSNNRMIVATPGGKMCIAANHPADIQRAWGVWEVDLQSYIKKHLRPGHIFVDVGAHRGTYTIMASHLVGGSGKVIAIEPFADHYECLMQTAAQSPYKNIELFNMACGSISGQAMFSEKERHVDDTGIQIPIAALDDIIASADFVKIDTDGRELDVLKGARKLIDNGASVIVEFSDFPYQPIDELWRDIRDFMANLGYSPYVIKKDGTVGSVVSLVHEIKDRHILFRPDRISLKSTV
jgi:FkbM family methyltransferase